MERGQNVIERVMILHTESVNTPKLPNSRLQSPIGFYKSGCLGLRSMVYVTYSNSLQINLCLSKLEKVPIRWNSRLVDEGAPFPDLCTSNSSV